MSRDKNFGFTLEFEVNRCDLNVPPDKIKRLGDRLANMIEEELDCLVMYDATCATKEQAVAYFAVHFPDTVGLTTRGMDWPEDGQIASGRGDRSKAALSELLHSPPINFFKPRPSS